MLLCRDKQWCVHGDGRCVSEVSSGVQWSSSQRSIHGILLSNARIREYRRAVGTGDVPRSRTTILMIVGYIWREDEIG